MDSDDSGHPEFENSRVWMLSSRVAVISSETRQKTKKTNKKKKTPSNYCANMTTGGVLHKKKNNTDFNHQTAG